MRKPALVLYLAALGAAVAVAQRPSFEVASVKANRSGEAREFIRSEPGGRVTVTNMPLKLLITFAYQLASYQLVGAPGWTASERFDIIAKLAGNQTVADPGAPSPIFQAAQVLLEDRFRLKAHRETREMDIYALVIAKPGGGPGPNLKHSSQDCDAMAAARRRGAPPPAPPRPGEPVVCSIVGGPGLLRFGGFPISRFTTTLGGQAGRMVVDRTGLTGNWEFDLRYAAEPRGQLSAEATAPPIDPDAPSLFTALQEQLGLKLESSRGPVDVLVVDSVERPAEE